MSGLLGPLNSKLHFQYEGTSYIHNVYIRSECHGHEVMVKLLWSKLDTHTWVSGFLVGTAVVMFVIIIRHWLHFHAQPRSATFTRLLLLVTWPLIVQQSASNFELK